MSKETESQPRETFNIIDCRASHDLGCSFLFRSSNDILRPIERDEIEKAMKVELVTIMPTRASLGPPWLIKAHKLRLRGKRVTREYGDVAGRTCRRVLLVQLGRKKKKERKEKKRKKNVKRYTLLRTRF